MKLRKLVRTYLITGAVAAGAPLLFCIDRDNPWDPYNGCHPEEEFEIRKNCQNYIDFIQLSLPRYAAAVDSLRAAFNTNKLINSQSAGGNMSLKERIDKKIAHNDSVDAAYRANGDCTIAGLKDTISEAFIYMKDVSGKVIHDLLDSLKIDRQKIDDSLKSAQRECPKSINFPRTFAGSYDSTAAQWSALLDSIVQYGQWVADTNSAIIGFNLKIALHNDDANTFNRNISFCKLPLLTDSLAIRKAIDSVMPGDTIALGTADVRVDNFNFDNKGARGTWTVIMGVPATKTVIRSQGVFIIASYNIKFVNLIFQNIDNGEGARVDESGNIVFSHCGFNGNRVYGLNANKSDSIILDTCVFLHNGGAKGDSTAQGGMRLSECGGTIDAVNILVAHNTGFGIDINKANVTITRGTISDNTLDGVKYQGPNGTGSLIASGTIFCFNGGNGIYRNNEQATIDIYVLAAQNNRFFGNGGSEMAGNITIVNANQPFISGDPMFTDRENDDYHISTASPISGTGYQYP